MSWVKGFSLLVLLIPLSAALTVHIPHVQPYLFADEAVYHGITQSLAFDADLEYDAGDFERICQDFPAGPRGIILKQDSSGRISYAKPILYGLLAAPFYRIWHLNGFLILNVVCAWIIFKLLARQWGNDLKAHATACFSLCFSAFSPYVVWFHPEIVTATLLALFLSIHLRTCDPETKTPNVQMPVYLGILIALAASIKPQLIVFALLPAGYLFRSGQKKRSGYFLVSITVMLSLILLANFILTGEVNPYSGNRKIFHDVYPLQTPGTTFESAGDGWSTENATFYFRWNVLVWNCLFFFIGRFSGLIPYFFPAFAVLALFVSGKKFRGSRMVLFLSGVLVLIQLIMIPANYHGGGGALGNRYLVVLYPAILLCIQRLPSIRWIAAVLVISAAFSAPYIISPFTASFYPGMHTFGALYKILPVEWTLTGSFPIFDPAYRHVSFDDTDTFYYFMDTSTTGKENDGFRLKGEQTAECLVDTSMVLDRFRFRVSETPVLTHLSIRTGAEEYTWDQGPGEERDIELPAGKGRIMTDIFGRERHIYRLIFKSGRGAIPKYLYGSGDSRYISARITPSAY